MDAIVRVAVLLLSPILLPALYASHRMLREFRGNGWTSVEGKIHSVTTHFKDPFWIAEFSYNYTLHGEYYAGYDQKRFAREAMADKFAAFFRPGYPITVRVNPSNPQASFIEDLYFRESAYERMTAM